MISHLLLCRLGVHTWRRIARRDFLDAYSLEERECPVCGLYQQFVCEESDYCCFSYWKNIAK